MRKILLSSLCIAALLAGSAPAQVAAPAVAQSQAQDRPQDTVIRYYRALGARDYRTAYHLWSGGGKASGQTYAAFKAGFAQTRSTFVRVTGPARLEGAAGSLFAEVPVRVRARLSSGQWQTFSGSYTLRRNNTGTGDPSTWNWHLYRGALQPQWGAQ